MSRTLVVGGTSYLGSCLIPRLLDAGQEATVVTRNEPRARLLLGPLAERVEIISPEGITANQLRAEAVINLAYARDVSSYDVLPATRALVTTLMQIRRAVNASRLIHVSTIAVFGYELKADVTSHTRPRPGGDAYQQGKALTEKLLERSFRDRPGLAVVRLGNVIGPGSAPWITALSQRLLEGRPSAYRGGKSNATFALNVADYLAHLSHAPIDALTEFGVHHHLAEFASRPWEEIASALARAMEVPLYLLPPNDSEAHEGIARRLNNTRVGSALRYLLYKTRSHRIGKLVADRELPSTAFVATPDDHPGFLQVVSSRGLVRTRVLSEWTPAFSFSDAIELIVGWLPEAGFAPVKES